MNSEFIVSNIKEKKVTKPKYSGRDNYYFDESGDYDHHRTECDVCDRSVFKRTLVHGLCEMCDEKVINKKLNYLHSKNKDKHKTEAELK